MPTEPAVRLTQSFL